MRVATCPKPTALATIAALTCPENFGQTQKLIFRRSGEANIAAADMILLAFWNNLLEQTYGIRAVITPYVENPTMEPGKLKEHGSGNEVRNGIGLNMGTSATKFTFKLNQYTESVIAGLRALQDESLVVFLVNEFGQFGCKEVATGYYNGIPIQQFFVSDRILGGLEAPDYYELSFQMPGNWSEDWKIVDPNANFSALSLVSRASGTDNTITLTSAAGTDDQTVNEGVAITDITYDTTGATGATIEDLPDGVTGAWADDEVTISGTPTEDGEFNYTITLTGGIGLVTETGTITVNAV